ncbi:MAG: SpoIID/LytB domain-containing protein [Candidatus Obscuribacterales bacterium]|nr:SpoIID/LytB domain-containing protein [Candidatus Obscuribacterales bacterium]
MWWRTKRIAVYSDVLICGTAYQSYNPEMVEVHFSGNPTEEEAAACLAVIRLLCGGVTTAHDCKTSLKPDSATQSAWGRASRLEQTGRSTCRKSKSLPLWSLAGRTMGLFSALAIAASSLLASVIGAASAGAMERTGFEPAAQTSTNNAATTINRAVRVALNASTGKISLSCPDGATIHNAKTQELLAQVPPRSTWEVCKRQASGSNQISFSGNIGNCAFSKVVVDRTLNVSGSPYRSASFQRGNSSGFRPQILDSTNPAFLLDLRPKGTTAQDVGGGQNYRAIGFSTVSPETARSAEPPETFLITPSRPDGLIGINNRLYRGQIELRATPATGQFAVINIVTMEDYLLSVVPAEMPGCWPLESLKAQAIAARSYAVANMGKHAADGYDVEPTVSDQVYAGVESETENSNRAVAETEGIVLKHQGKVVSAFFHSAGGGCTELAEHVWGRPVPYLKSVVDYDDRSPHFTWTRQFPVTAADECVKKSGKDIGQLLSVMPLVKTASGRLKSAMLIGTTGPIVVSGEELRRIFALPSSLFNACVDNDCYVFAGRGFGHGLGMSQWGAKSLAEQGYNAAQILSYYYKDVSIEQMQPPGSMRQL